MCVCVCIRLEPDDFAMLDLPLCLSLTASQLSENSLAETLWLALTNTAKDEFSLSFSLSFHINQCPANQQQRASAKSEREKEQQPIFSYSRALD